MQQVIAIAKSSLYSTKFHEVLQNTVQQSVYNTVYMKAWKLHDES